MKIPDDAIKIIERDFRVGADAAAGLTALSLEKMDAAPERFLRCVMFPAEGGDLCAPKKMTVAAPSAVTATSFSGQNRLIIPTGAPCKPAISTNPFIGSHPENVSIAHRPRFFLAPDSRLEKL